MGSKPHSNVLKVLIKVLFVKVYFFSCQHTWKPGRTLHILGMVEKIKVSDILLEAFYRSDWFSPNKQSQEINDFSFGEDAVKWALILKGAENIDNVILESYLFCNIYKEI